MAVVVNRASAATVSFATPQEIVINQADDSIKIGDGVNLVTTTTVGSDVGLDVNVLQSALPTGAATAAKQDTGNTSLSSIDTKLTSQATAANQATGNASLSSIDGKLVADGLYASGSIASGTPTLEISTSGYGTVIAHIGTDLFPTTALGFSIDFQATLDGTNWVQVSGANLTLLDGQIPLSTSDAGPFAFSVAGFTKFRLNASIPIGSVNCALRADKSVAVINQIQALTFAEVTASALPAGAATGTKQDTGNTSLSSIDTKLSKGASASVAQVASSASSVTLLASNANRIQALFFNDSTATLSLKFGTTASSSSFTVKIPPSGFFEIPFPMYTGRVDGIWNAANGNCLVTEVT